MHILNSDKIVFCDVDDTLIGWSKPEKGPDEFWVTTTCHGMVEHHWVIKENLEALKKHKGRGHLIVVWSQGGWEWAEAVVKALKIEHLVDLVCSKPEWIYDDLEASVWMPKAKHLGFNKVDEETLEDDGASENP